MSEDAKVAVVKPGDTLLVLVPPETGPDESFHIKERFRALCPGAQVALVGGDIRLVVVEKG